jgi:hypothetical protein
MRHIDDDFEIEAIDKCSRALSKLDDKTKIRVIKYLLDKFGLLVQNDNQPKEVVSQNIQYQQNNLVLAEPKDISALPTVSISLPTGSTIALKDILIKNLAKTEPELLVVIAYYNSNFGKSTFTRQSILDSYKEHGVSTEIRRKNLSSNLNSLIKKYYVNTITDDEYSISIEGCEYANNILSGNTNTKKRKPRLKKNKPSKKDNSVEIETTENENEDDE